MTIIRQNNGRGDIHCSVTARKAIPETTGMDTIEQPLELVSPVRPMLK
jgi:hypothetical protein